MCDISHEIQECLSEDGVNAEVRSCEETDGKIMIEVSVTGDWKHDHARMKYLLERTYGAVLINENVDESYDDWYSADYTFCFEDSEEDSEEEYIEDGLIEVGFNPYMGCYDYDC